MKIVVVVANGLHIGYVGCYGNSWIETPYLDAVAAAGIVFDRHIGANPDVAVARSIFCTGRYQFLHASTGAIDGFTAYLQGQGIATRFLHTHHAGAPERTMRSVAQTLDDLADEEHWFLQFESDDLLSASTTAELASDAAQTGSAEQHEAPISDMQEEDEEPIHEEDASFLQQQVQYAGAVAQYDAWIGQLVGELKNRGLDDKVHLVLTSHCGRSLGEHVSPFPTWSQLHEEIIHLPFIVRLPGGGEAGRRISALTQPVDFLPTVCDLFGVLCSTAQGLSLVPLFHGKVRQIRSYACAGRAQGSTLELAMRTPEWSFHLPASDQAGRKPLLYVLPDDRWEVNNLRQHSLDWVERLEKCVRDFVQAAGMEGPLQPPPLPDFIAKDEQESASNQRYGGP